jgi:hypothetical protein
MKKFFAPNIGKSGRAVRGILAIALFVAAGFAFVHSVVEGVLLLIAGLFVLYESLRGWCVVRACGIKTML